MSNWKRLAASLEGQYDSLRARLEARLGPSNAPVQIVSYEGFGTAEGIRLKGRILQARPPGALLDQATTWDNMLAAYRRFHSRERPGVRVEATLLGHTQEAVSDEEGYFMVYLAPQDPVPMDRLWHEVTLTLPDFSTPDGQPVQATGRVIIPRPDTQFVVISDVDDTILQTHATNKLRMAQLTFLHNARTRLPFEGVAAFYGALQHREAGPANPLFYVSSSPWNLHDLLSDFIDLQGIPAGPLLLRDFGIDEQKFFADSHGTHKSGHIARLMETFPDLDFVLIGDSGQHDPEIYTGVAEAFPGRVRAIYIRDVSDTGRDMEVDALNDRTSAVGTPLIRIPDTLAAARDAAQRGLIDPAELDAIAVQKAEDEATPDLIR